MAIEYKSGNLPATFPTLKIAKNDPDKLVERIIMWSKNLSPNKLKHSTKTMLAIHKVSYIKKFTFSGFDLILYKKALYRNKEIKYPNIPPIARVPNFLKIIASMPIIALTNKQVAPTTQTTHSSCYSL